MAATAPPRPADARPAAPGRLARLLGDPRRVLLVTAALAALAACVDVLHDPDLFWHLRLGRWILDHHAVPNAEMFSYTAQGNAMTAHEWLSEVLFALVVSAGGLLLLALLMGLVAWSGLLALVLRARDRGVGPVVAAVALLLGARAAEPVLGTRPQVFTVALVCWTLLLAERHLARGGRLVWLIAPLALPWANLHAGFLFGLAAPALLAGLEAVRRVLGRPEVASWRRIGELLGATGLGAGLACLNPDGPGLYAYVLHTSATERLMPITEWHSPDFSDPSNLGLLVLMVSFLVLLAMGGRPGIRDLGLSAIGFAAALYAVRNTSLAVAFALPGWAAMLQQVVDRVAARRARGATAAGGARPRPPATARSALAFGAVIVALGVAVDGVVVARAAQDASDRGVAQVYPACTVAALQGLGGVRLVAPYYQSGYLIRGLWPGTHVFLYGESASLGLALYDQYQRIYSGGDVARQLLESHGSNAVLVGPGALYDTMRTTAGWRAVLDDPMGATLFVDASLGARLPDRVRC